MFKSIGTDKSSKQYPTFVTFLIMLPFFQIYMPANKFKRVVFPAPFFPIMPTISPIFMCLSAKLAT